MSVVLDHATIKSQRTWLKIKEEIQMKRKSRIRLSKKGIILDLHISHA
jgi:hypothetical protein